MSDQKPVHPLELQLKQLAIQLGSLYLQVRCTEEAMMKINKVLLKIQADTPAEVKGE